MVRSFMARRCTAGDCLDRTGCSAGGRGEADGARERVAVEMSRESALELMEKIKAALASGDAAHTGADACSIAGSKEEVAALF